MNPVPVASGMGLAPGAKIQTKRHFSASGPGTVPSGCEKVRVRELRMSSELFFGRIRAIFSCAPSGANPQCEKLGPAGRIRAGNLAGIRGKGACTKMRPKGF